MGFLIKQTVDMLSYQAVESTKEINAFSGDNASHTWVVNVTNSAGWLSEKTAKVSVILPSGSTVTIAATISGDVINATFPASAFAEIGEVTAYMKIYSASKVTSTTAITTIAAIHFYVS